MKKNCFFVFIFCALFSLSRAQAPVIGSIGGPANVCWSSAAGITYTTAASNSPSSYAWSVLPAAGVGSMVVTVQGASVLVLNFPNGNDTYTIYCSATNGSGTSATTSLVVNVFQKPQVTFSGNTIFCQGSSTSISASPTQASPTQGSSTQGSSILLYSWSPGTGLNTTFGPNVIANPTITTTYTVTVLNGPCTSTAPLTVIVQSIPTLSITASNDTICEGESVMLTASGASFYQWSTGSMSDTTWVNPPAGSWYAVTGTDAKGCSASIVMFQEVDVCTGIKDHSSGLSGSTIYPNPTTGVLTIDPGGTGNETVRLEIANALGQVVLRDAIRVSTAFDLSQLSSGIYIVTLRQNTSVKTLKLIRE